MKTNSIHFHKLDSLRLVSHLDQYAETGSQYVEVLKKIIIQNKLKDYELVDDTFYLNDFVCLIKKNSLENTCNGKIISVNGNEITIRNNQHNITLDSKLYYVFIKRNLSKNNDRQFYKSLLEKL